MRRYRVRFTPEAEEDLLRLYDFLLERDVAAAERALDAIRGAVELLRFSWRAQSPRPWQSADPTRAEIFSGRRVSSSTSAARWVGQLLSSSGRVGVGRDLGHYADVDRVFI